MMYERYLAFGVGVRGSIWRSIVIIKVGVDYSRSIYDVGVNKKRRTYKVKTERT